MRDVKIKKNISIKIFERACVKTQKFFLTNFQFSFFSKNSDKNQFFQFAEITTNNDKERQRTTNNDKERQRTTNSNKFRQIPSELVKIFWLRIARTKRAVLSYKMTLTHLLERIKVGIKSSHYYYVITQSDFIL